VNSFTPQFGRNLGWVILTVAVRENDHHPIGFIPAAKFLLKFTAGMQHCFFGTGCATQGLGIF
jgi:hypothetical protein